MIKKTLVLLCTLLCCASLFLPVSAEEYDRPVRLIDTEFLLNDEEYYALLGKLDAISEQHDFDTVIVTLDTLEGYGTQEMADDIFDYENYGMGSDRSGILFLIVIEDREWAISTRGYGITAFTDAGQQHIINKIQTDLSDGNYSAAFDAFADLCDDFLTQAESGVPYDRSNLPKMPLPNIWSGIAFLVGLAAAFIITQILKGQLKTVRQAAGAGNYVRPDSLNVTKSRETFLYRNLDRVARESGGSSGKGGSSTHRSSSGARHGGSSGRF